MIPLKPYLLRAYFDWIIDNNWTPLILVDATVPDVDVPRAFVKDGKIALNLALRAVRNLEMEAGSVSFSARFGGAPHKVFIPMSAVLAIYAEENGQILSFPPEPADENLPVPVASESKAATPASEPTRHPEKPEPTPRPTGRPALRVVKKEN